MSANDKLVKGWLFKAESDFATVQKLIHTDGPFDTACFHIQQTIEKLLKAFLIFHGKPVPKIHDLEELQRQCILIEPFAELQQLDFSQITDFAVEIRYDIEFWPNL
jgi:HEPN domain-containing protein